MALVLSENEYRLVRVVLEEAPMLPANLAPLAAARLMTSKEDVRALLDDLLDREVLSLKEGLVISKVTRQEADQTAIHRALTFNPLWPAPNPPPEPEAASAGSFTKELSEEMP